MILQDQFFESLMICIILHYLRFTPLDLVSRAAAQASRQKTALSTGRVLKGGVFEPLTAVGLVEIHRLVDPTDGLCRIVDG